MQVTVDLTVETLLTEKSCRLLGAHDSYAGPCLKPDDLPAGRGKHASPIEGNKVYPPKRKGIKTKIRMGIIP